MTQELEKYQEKVFEDIKHIDEYGNEYWEARELQKILGYKEWRLFANVIEKAQWLALEVIIILVPILGFTPKS